MSSFNPFPDFDALRRNKPKKQPPGIGDREYYQLRSRHVPVPSTTLYHDTHPETLPRIPYPGSTHDTHIPPPPPRHSQNQSLGGQYYSPSNPHHLFISDEKVFREFSIQEVLKIASRRQEFIKIRHESGPSNRNSKARKDLIAIANRSIEQKRKSITPGDKQTLKLLVRQAVEYMKAVKVKYSGETLEKAKAYDAAIERWREKNSKALEFFRKLSENTRFFVEKNGKVVANPQLTDKLAELKRQLIKYKLIETGHWTFTRKGMELLASIGYKHDTLLSLETEGSTFLGGVKRTPLNISIDEAVFLKNTKDTSAQLVRKQLERNIRKVKNSILAFQKALKRDEQRIRVGIEYLTGISVHSQSEEQRMKVYAGNKQLGDLVRVYRENQEILEELEQELDTALREEEVLGPLLEPKIKDLEQKSQALEAVFRNTDGKFRKWSNEKKIEDVMPFRSGQYADVPLRYIPMDYLYWVNSGAFVDKEEVHEFEKEGKNYVIPLPMLKRDKVPYGWGTIDRVKKYLNSPHGQQRLREFYGTAFPDYIKVIDRHMGDVLMEKSIIVQETLNKKLGPVGLNQLRREAGGWFAGMTEEQEYNAFFKQGLNANMTPEQAKNYAENAQKESNMENPNNKKWHIPIAFQDQRLPKEDKQQIEKEMRTGYKDIDNLRKLLARFSEDEVKLILWPPKEPLHGYTSQEKSDATRNFYILQAQVLQTNPLDYHTATGGPKEELGVSYNSAGWRPSINSDYWKKMEGDSQGPWLAAFQVEDMIMATNIREDLVQLRGRLTELFHDTMIEHLIRDANSGSSYATEEQTRLAVTASYENSFMHDPDAPYIKYLHNIIQERINLFAHPDVVPLDPTTGLSGDESASAYERAAKVDLPFPEDTLPDHESDREWYDEKQDKEDDLGRSKQIKWNALHTEQWTPEGGRYLGPRETSELGTPFASVTADSNFDEHFSYVKPTGADDLATGEDIIERRKTSFFPFAD